MSRWGSAGLSPSEGLECARRRGLAARGRQALPSGRAPRRYPCFVARQVLHDHARLSWSGAPWFISSDLWAVALCVGVCCSAYSGVHLCIIARCGSLRTCLPSAVRAGTRRGSPSVLVIPHLARSAWMALPPAKDSLHVVESGVFSVRTETEAEAGHGFWKVGGRLSSK